MLQSCSLEAETKLFHVIITSLSDRVTLKYLFLHLDCFSDVNFREALQALSKVTAFHTALVADKSSSVRDVVWYVTFISIACRRAVNNSNVHAA